MKKLSEIVLSRLCSNEFESSFLRKYYASKFGIQVGLYSYGCFDTSRIPRGTKIGRYCSFAKTASFFPRNHGISYLSTHPYFYNSALGVIPSDTIQNTQFVVEDDVWIGHNATITSKASKIGRGSIVAANSVVTKSVPPYAIVAGNPAKVIRFRFSDEVIEKVEDTRWWEMSKEELIERIPQEANFFYEPEAYFHA